MEKKKLKKIIKLSLLILVNLCMFSVKYPNAIITTIPIMLDISIVLEITVGINIQIKIIIRHRINKINSFLFLKLISFLLPENNSSFVI